MKSLAGPAGTFLGRAVARLLTSWGRFRLVCGDAAGAVSAFEGVVLRAPLAFDGWIHLARAHLRSRDLAPARRALARAREVSFARFEREAAGWVRREGFEIQLLADGGAARDPVPRRHVMKSAGRGAHALPFGDCSDLDEYARFRAMPPIAPGELDDVDWDEVAEDLQDG